MGAPDVFISYAHPDAGMARIYAEAFKRAGLNVWWDNELRSGEIFDETIEAALAAAKAVVVLWSPHSVASRWVRAEATAAERANTLVPVMITPCRRPIIFELLHTAELSHWSGEAEDGAWQAFLAHVTALVGKHARPQHAGPQQAGPSAASAPTGSSVVVLPFANMSGDPEQDYFADGVSEDIITDLSKVSALLVIARNTAFSFKGKAVDVKQVAQQLGVTHVLEGSVRKAGNRVRVTAQLIDGATAGHVWAERYDRDLDDIFAIQDELSEAIVNALKVRLLPREKQAIEERETRSAEAYDYYLKARALRATMNLDDIPKSLVAYRKAIEIDPDFALAWAGLGSSLVQNRVHFPNAEGLTDEEIDGAIGRATALAPDSLDVAASRAQRAAFQRDWDAAADCVTRFRKGAAENWSIHSHLLLILGKAQEAATHQQKVRKADPLSIGGSWALQFHLTCAGRFDEADAEYRKSETLPGGFGAMTWEAVKRRAARGDMQGAKADFVAEFGADTQFIPYAGDLAAVIDDIPKASAILRAALADPSQQHQLGLIGMADCAVLVGDDDLAFEAMRAAYIGARGLMVVALWHPIYAHLRPDPRFKQILVDLGLAGYWRRTGDWGDFARPLGEGDFELIA